MIHHYPFNVGIIAVVELLPVGNQRLFLNPFMLRRAVWVETGPAGPARFYTFDVLGNAELLELEGWTVPEDVKREFRRALKTRARKRP